MDDERSPATSPRLFRLLKKMAASKPYRDSYVASHTRQFLARQMRAFRGERSQKEFGEVLDKPQSVVSRLEDPRYGKWTLQTLFDVASKMDVAVYIRFVDHETFVRMTGDSSDNAQRPRSFNEIPLSASSAYPHTSTEERNFELEHVFSGSGEPGRGEGQPTVRIYPVAASS